MVKRILIDCDPGIDDSLAIILALKSDEVKIEGITTVNGNLPVENTSINALKILEFMNSTDIPVAKGMSKPLVRHIPRDPFSHGDDGLGNTNLPMPTTKLISKFAPNFIVDKINEYPNEITLVATAPLTNIAMALLMDPTIAKKVKEVILIGGSFGFTEYAYTRATGDNPMSEWNVYVDPEAAKIVFNSGMPIKAVGLDIATHPKINFRDKDIERLKNSDREEAKYILKIVDYLSNRNFEPYCVLIDSLAVAESICEGIVKTTPVHVDVETKGEVTLGQTVVDRREHFKWVDLPVINASYDADFDKFLDMVVDVLVK